MIVHVFILKYQYYTINFWYKNLAQSALFFAYKIDKYGNKHTDIQTNIKANIGGKYERIIIDVVYIREGTVRVYKRESKYMRRQIYGDSTFEWPNIYLIQTDFHHC